MLGWRMFLIGVFLIPFARVTPLPGSGASVGDGFLIVGGLFVLIGGGKRLPRSGASWFIIPGAALVFSALLAGLLSDEASGRAALGHAVQYGYALILIPLVLAKQGFERLLTAIYTLLLGLTVSVAVGALIIWAAPGFYSTLLSLGIMDAKAGREGMFAGVGEISKLSSMALPLAYLLIVSGRLKAVQGAAFVAAPLGALILSRSGAATIAATIAVGVVALGHVAFRSRIRRAHPRQNSGRATLSGLIGVAGAIYAIRKLDQSGAQYFAEFSARVTTPLESGGITEVGSADARAGLVDEAWRMLGDVPVLGIGAEQYRVESTFNTSVHVVPLSLWIELGLLALIAWVVLMVTATVGVLAAGRRDPLVTVAGLGVMTAFLISNLSLPYLYPRTILVPAVLACMLAAAASRPAPETVETTPDMIRT